MYLAVVALMVFLATVPGASAQEIIDSTTTRTETVERFDHDAYRIENPGNHRVSVLVTAHGRTVDFYVFSSSQYNTYTDPLEPTFGYTHERQRAQAYSYETTGRSFILVIDNDIVSTTGASPTGNVTYTLEVTYTEISLADASAANVCFVGLGSLVLLAVATTVWLYRAPAKYRDQSAQLQRVLR